MKTAEISGSVIWRLPGSDDIHCLESSAGEDEFLISSFDKTRDLKVIRGMIIDFGNRELDDFFVQWPLLAAVDKTSTIKEDYISGVEKARSEMGKGRLEKVVLARRKWLEGTVHPAGLFKTLLSQHKNAFVYAFNADGKTMIGASPETLLSRKGGQLYTEALGGTFTHGKVTQKEFLEHRHISTYIGALLKQHDYAFSMDAMREREAGRVKHLLTSFTTESRGFAEDIELAFSLHPTPAVCGLPYSEAFDFIEKTENFDRNFYSGFLGPVKGEQDFSFFVNLRCAELYADGLLLFAGAGLNQMSDADDEWMETERKMQTIGQWL